jgi:hypothetical protein
MPTNLSNRADWHEICAKNYVMLAFSQAKGVCVMESTLTKETTNNHDTRPAPKVGRRAIIATGAVAALSVGIVEAPLAVNLGRRFLAEELANLEGIGLDTASAAVDATYQAVELIIEPVAGALSSISAESLDGLILAVDSLLKIPGLDGTVAAGLKNLKTILQAWKVNVNLFPATIAQLDAQPRDAGKQYLATLKAKQHQEAAKV